MSRPRSRRRGANDLRGRLLAIGRGVRSWALANEHQYALIYGTPVPDYQAPQDTIGPASRVTELLVVVLVEAAASGRLAPLPEPTAAELRSVQPLMDVLNEQGAQVPAELLIRGLMAWTLMFGAVSFELFGHVHNVIADEHRQRSPFFDGEMDRMADYLGLR